MREELLLQQIQESGNLHNPQVLDTFNEYLLNENSLTGFRALAKVWRAALSEESTYNFQLNADQQLVMVIIMEFLLKVDSLRMVA